MKIGLRICVNTLHGLQEGVPNLLRLLNTYQVKATFYFAVGPDRNRHLLNQVKISSPKSEGLLARLVRSLTPPLMISEKGGDIMRSVAADGHETGLLCYDPLKWYQKAAYADKKWTQSEFALGIESFESVFGRVPNTIAAPGWQLNPHVLAEEKIHGFEFASDVRGKAPFYPEMLGIESDCVQLPTTLSSMRDLMTGGLGVNSENVHEFLYSESQYILPHGHVYSLDADLEGIDMLKIFEKLVVMWRGYSEGLVPLKEIYKGLDRNSINKHRIGWSNKYDPNRYEATQSVVL